MLGYFDLNERLALVTGASRGLGLAMAEALAEVGATVILNGRDANTLKSPLTECAIGALRPKLRRST
jgi:gluconate 5-dehydrogenase